MKWVDLTVPIAYSIEWAPRLLLLQLDSETDWLRLSVSLARHVVLMAWTAILIEKVDNADRISFL